MSEDVIKEVIRQAKKLLFEKKDEAAMELCEKHIDDGVKDYMIYCFAALANANQNYPVDSSTHYIEAIKIDASKPIAWQGLFKLYDKQGLPVDERAIETAEKAATFAADDEKKEYCLQKKREFLLTLKRFVDLKEDPGEDPILMGKLIEVLTERENKSESEKSLLLQAFKTIGFELVWKDVDLHRRYVKYQYEISKTYCDWEQEFMRFCEFHPKQKLDTWMYERLDYLIHIGVLVQGVVNENLLDVYNRTHTDEEDDFPLNLLDALNDEDWDDAAGIVLEIPELSLVENGLQPAIYTAVRVMYEDENYEKCLSYIALAQQRTSDPLLREQLHGYRAASLLGLMTPESLRIGLGMCPLTPKFEYSEILLNFHSGREVVVSDIKSEANRLRFSLFQALRNGQDAEAKSIALESEKFDGTQTWQDNLMRAEANLADEATLKQLVDLGQDHPSCAKVFYFLAKALRGKNVTKAKSCAERAVSLKEGCEECILLLDDILIETGTSPSVRLAQLEKMTKRTHWLQERLYPLYLGAGQIDKAINSLQHLLRDNPEDAHLWGELGAAYLQRGSLQAAVNAYLEAARLQPDSDYILPMLHVLFRLGNVDELLEHADNWRATRNADIDGDKDAHFFVSLLEIQAKFTKCKEMTGSEMIEALQEIYDKLGALLDKRLPYTILYKTAADILIFCASFHTDVFSQLNFPATLTIKEPADCWKGAISLLGAVLSAKNDSASAWADIGIALTLGSRALASIPYAKKAVSCLKQAIRLSDDAGMRSIYWGKLGDALSAKEAPFPQQQHAYLRAIELNRANSEAWCRLALLYEKFNLHSESKQACETGLKINPECGFIWTVYGLLAAYDAKTVAHEPAILADLDAVAIDSFCQALTYRPTEVAVEELSSFLAHSARHFDAAGSRIKFEKVLALLDRGDRAPHFVLRLTLLAECFGYFDEALDILMSSGLSELAQRQIARLKLYRNEKPESRCPVELEGLANLASLPSEQLADLLGAKMPVYNSIFEKLATGEGLNALCRYAKPPIHIPLVISYILAYKKELHKASINALHDVRPRHEFLDVWPIEVDDELDNELSYLEDDGEEPFRLRHQYAKNLHKWLAERRAIWVAEHPKEPNQDVISVLTE